MKNSLVQFDIPRASELLHESVIEKTKNTYPVINVYFQHCEWPVNKRDQSIGIRCKIVIQPQRLKIKTT